MRLGLLVLALGAVVAASLLLRAEPSPYVVTAIDYHFHDAHPTFPIEPGRDLVVKNAGSNVHNVTIESLGIVHDIQPGGEFVIPDIGGQLGPGTYELVCRFHLDREMTGEIVIAGP
jgi:plastocyanin